MFLKLYKLIQLGVVRKVGQKINRQYWDTRPALNEEYSNNKTYFF